MPIVAKTSECSASNSLLCVCRRTWTCVYKQDKELAVHVDRQDAKPIRRQGHRDAA